MTSETLTALTRDAVRLERSRLLRGGAVANAAGYALPLLVGLATGHLHAGVAASTGALIVGFANLGGPRRVRAETLLVTTLAVGLAALLGGFAGADAIVLVGLWGFVAGLAVALGTRAAFVGVLSTWALLVASDLPLHGAAIPREAVLMTLGGLITTLLASIPPAQPDLTSERLQHGAAAHATRVAAGLVVAVAVYHVLDLRFGFWVPMTVLFVLRPGYGATTTRVTERALGTLAGVALAALLVSAFHPSDTVIVAALIVIAAPAYALYHASYAAASVLFTVSVALLAELSGGSAAYALGDRLLDTATGVAIALCVVNLGQLHLRVSAHKE